MRLGRFVVVLGLLAVCSGIFAQQPKGRVSWSKESGRLESRDAHALVTALVIEDSAQPPKRMRGIRIDFSWSDKQSSIYLAESLIPGEKKIFDDLTRDIESSDLQGGTGSAFLGSCEFRDHPGVYPLEADYKYSGSNAPALRIIGPTREQILFPGLMPRRLSEVLGDAIDELKAH